jgi:hypothetical protein
MTKERDGDALRDSLVTKRCYFPTLREIEPLLDHNESKLEGQSNRKRLLT